MLFIDCGNAFKISKKKETEKMINTTFICKSCNSTLTNEAGELYCANCRRTKTAKTAKCADHGKLSTKKGNVYCFDCLCAASRKTYEKAGTLEGHLETGGTEESWNNYQAALLEFMTGSPFKPEANEPEPTPEPAKAETAFERERRERREHQAAVLEFRNSIKVGDILKQQTTGYLVQVTFVPYDSENPFADISFIYVCKDESGNWIPTNIKAGFGWLQGMTRGGNLPAHHFDKYEETPEQPAEPVQGEDSLFTLENAAQIISATEQELKNSFSAPVPFNIVTPQFARDISAEDKEAIRAELAAMPEADLENECVFAVRNVARCRRQCNVVINESSGEFAAPEKAKFYYGLAKAEFRLWEIEAEFSRRANRRAFAKPSKLRAV